MLSGSSVLEIDDASRTVVALCDGCHTVQDIAAVVACQQCEPVETVVDELVPFLDMLVEEGVIQYYDTPEYISPLYAYDRPLSVIWEITYACNQACQYCIARAGKAAPDELSRKEMDTILQELISLDVGLINITGGEPLLKKETALHIAKKASENGIELELLTNAMLVTEEVAHELHEAGIRYAQVSIDCVHPEVHDAQRGVAGAWERAVNGITRLRDAGIEVMAAAVMNKETLPYFMETAKFLENCADKVKMGPVQPMGRGEKSELLLTPEMYYDLQVLRSTTPDNQLVDFIFCKERCSIGTTPVICPNGDVYPCMLTKYKELKLGNLKKESFRSIYKNSEVLHELFQVTVDDIEKCNSCWNRYYCGGGCRGCAFAYHGTIYKWDPYQCEGERKFARALLKWGHPETKRALKELLRLSKNLP